LPRQQETHKVRDLGGHLGLKINYEWPDLDFIITSLEEQGVIDVNRPNTISGSSVRGRALPESLSLTFLGWQKYSELQRSIKDSRKAFVAMEFPDPNKKEKNYFFQDILLEKYLVPAAKQAGYEIGNPLAKDPKAGNLHARLEVEIRASRFIIAELSHHNNGAYWEAGFARGLGIPVIYMFNRKIGGGKPHFDVGSDLIVFWEEDKPDEAAQALKAVIRATLYEEAILVDD
jgi:hypothetical protein